MLTLEAQTIARACGKSHVHNLEPEDLVALTVEAAAMARVPLAGTDWIPGSERRHRNERLGGLVSEQRGVTCRLILQSRPASAGSNIS